MAIINDIKLTQNMAYGSLELSDSGHALIVGHNENEPDNLEWNQYLNYSLSMIDKYKFNKVFVQSIGGGPNRAQIQKMINTVYAEWREVGLKPKICVYSALGENWTVNATLRMKVVLIRGIMWLAGIDYIKYTTDRIEALRFIELSSDASAVIAASDFLQNMLKTYNEKRDSAYD